MQRADVAMYQAKEGRTGVERYVPELDGNSVQRLALAGDLRTALEREEFVLHYQPKVDLRTNAVSGAEVLLRWAHPVHGWLAPDEFIPLAEHTGLIGSARWRSARSGGQRARKVGGADGDRALGGGRGGARAGANDSGRSPGRRSSARRCAPRCRRGDPHGGVDRAQARIDERAAVAGGGGVDDDGGARSRRHRAPGAPGRLAAGAPARLAAAQGNCWRPSSSSV